MSEIKELNEDILENVSGGVNGNSNTLYVGDTNKGTRTLLYNGEKDKGKVINLNGSPSQKTSPKSTLNKGKNSGELI